MGITGSNIALIATMFISLAVLRFMAPLPLFYTGLFSLPPTVLFAIPLCETFLLGFRVARRAMRANSSQSPRRQFRGIMAPRAKTWILLWGGYFFLWEAMLFPRIDCLGPATCLMALSLMTAACLLWAPRFKRLLSLILLVLACAPAAVIAFWFLALMLLTTLAEAKLWNPGYMNMGLAFGPPLAAIAMSLATAPIAWAWTLWKGEAWFAPRVSTSKEDLGEETETALASIDEYLRAFSPYRWFQERKKVVYGPLVVTVLAVILVSVVLSSGGGQNGNVTCLDVVKNVFGRPVRAAVGEHFACYTLTAHFNVLDISHPSEKPSQTASTWLSAEDSHALAASGDRVFMADGAGLTIFDLSDVKNPMVGSTAFIASSLREGSSYLRILDLTTPSNPAVRTSLDTSGIAQDVSVSGSLAYVTLGGAGMLIVDISDPASPQVGESYRPYAQGRLEIYFSTVNARGSLVLVDNRRGPTEGLHVLRYNPAQDRYAGHTNRKEPTR